MEKKDVLFSLVKIGIICLVMVMFFTTAAANDWSELNALNESELIEKTKEFKRRLDREPTDYEIMKGLGIAYHILAREDAKKYAHKSIEALTKVYERDKKDFVAMCYLGSSTTMMANTTWDQMEKGSYASKGIALMDKAVRKDPDNPSVRLTRAYNSMGLPDFLNRGGVGIEDFEHLAEMIEKDPETYGHLKQEVYRNLIKLYEKNGQETEARRYALKLKEN